VSTILGYRFVLIYEAPVQERMATDEV